MQYPDYRNGLVNLSNSILRSFGAPCRHSTLSDLDQVLDRGYQNVVLMLFDGMGMDALETHLSETSFLRRHLFKNAFLYFSAHHDRGDHVDRHRTDAL